jgi:Tol biopolymer transport system component
MQLESRISTEDAEQTLRLTALSAVDARLARAFLDKVCASAEFARSEQMSRFLRFLVEQRISGETTVLSERLIGVRVFGKEPGWDPREDTIVRTEARRLRSKIDSYYLGVGREDRVRFSLPKGAYRVQIEIAEAVPEPVQPSAPRLEIAQPPQRTPTWKLRILAASLVLGGLLVVIAQLWRSRPALDRAGGFEIVPIANEIGEEYGPAVSPDGRQVAYVWDGDGVNLDIYVKNLAGGPPRRITDDPRPDLYPSWSPDGRSLAYVRRGDPVNDIVVRPAAAGAERTITQIAMEFGHWADDNSPLLGNPGPVWTHNGKRLIVADVSTHAKATGLYSVAIDSGEREQITAPIGEMRDFYPKVSPDGTQLAYVRYLTHGIGQLYVLPIDPETGRPRGEPRQVTSEKKTIRGIDWDPTGKSLVFASNRLGQFQMWTISLAGGAPTLVTTDTSSVADPSAGSLNGDLVFVKIVRNWNIWRAPLLGGAPGGVMGTPQRLISSSGENRDPCYSPDGKQIAFMSDRTGELQIYVADADGTHVRQITQISGMFTSAPVWSPHGKFLAFDARPEGHAAIFTVPATGGTATPLNNTEAEERAPFWSRDGRFIYFDSNRSGIVALWKRELPDGKAVQIAGKDSFLAQETPDGRSLYFSDKRGNLFQSDVDGKDAKPLPAEVHPTPVNSWVPTNHAFYFTVPLANGHSQIRRFERGRVSVVGETAAPLVVNAKDISVSPDGTSILFAEQDFVGSDVLIRRTSTRR